MIYILLILLVVLAVLVLGACILVGALAGYALSCFVDIISYKIVTTVRGKQK